MMSLMGFRGAVKSLLLVSAISAAWLSAAGAWAGREELLQNELVIAEREESNPAAQKRRALQQRIQQLEEKWRQSFQDLPADRYGQAERDDIRKQIVDLERQILGIRQEPARHFPNANNKAAVFTFQGPANTTLGDDLAFILSKRILFYAQVESLAVVNFHAGLAPDESGLSYFEKVERVTENQGYIVSVWGNIARTKRGYRLDTYMEFNPARQPERFVVSARIPGRGGTMSARVAPSRVWVQSLEFDEEAAAELAATAQQIRTLRQEADAESPVVRELQGGDQYWIRDSNREGWVELDLRKDKRGWTSVSAFCRNACAKILDAADFVMAIMRYANYGPWEPELETLTSNAVAISDQVRVVEALEYSNYDQARELIGQRLEDGADAYSAIFANFQAVTMAKTRKLENDSTARAYLAERLARASLNDPSNTDTLRNLATLFRIDQDAERSGLAVSLFDREMIKGTGRRQCVSIDNLRKIGWASGEPKSYCAELGFDGMHSPRSNRRNNFCYQGDELACVTAIDLQAGNR